MLPVGAEQLAEGAAIIDEVIELIGPYRANLDNGVRNAILSVDVLARNTKFHVQERPDGNNYLLYIKDTTVESDADVEQTAALYLLPTDLSFVAAIPTQALLRIPGDMTSVLYTTFVIDQRSAGRIPTLLVHDALYALGSGVSGTSRAERLTVAHKAIAGSKGPLKLAVPEHIVLDSEAAPGEPPVSTEVLRALNLSKQSRHPTLGLTFTPDGPCPPVIGYHFALDQIFKLNFSFKRDKQDYHLPNGIAKDVLVTRLYLANSDYSDLVPKGRFRPENGLLANASAGILNKLNSTDCVTAYFDSYLKIDEYIKTGEDRNRQAYHRKVIRQGAWKVDRAAHTKIPDTVAVYRRVMEAQAAHIRTADLLAHYGAAGMPLTPARIAADMGGARLETAPDMPFPWGLPIGT